MPPRLEGVKRAPAKRRRPQRPPADVFGPVGRADAPLQPAQRVVRRSVQRARPATRSRPTGVFGQALLAPPTRPLVQGVQRASRQAARRERAAANRLPSRPSLPIVPRLATYTPQQARYIQRRVGPAVLRAIVHEGHAEGYASDLAHHERGGAHAGHNIPGLDPRLIGRVAVQTGRGGGRGGGRSPGTAPAVSSPFARLLRNSNAQERQTLHVFERLGGAAAVNGAVESARRQTVRAQLDAVLAGKAPNALAADLERRGYLERQHMFGSASFPKIGGYYTTKKAGRVGAPVGRTHFAVSAGSTGVGESFLQTPAALAAVSRTAGEHLGGAGTLAGRAGSDLILGPTMAAGTLAHLAVHPIKGGGETAHALSETFKHPVKSFEAHPVWTLQAFEGARAAGGRAIGAGLRAATKGRVGGLSRDPLSMVGDQGTRLTYPRRYSKDIMRQGVQRLADKRLKPVLAGVDGLRTEAADLRARAHDAAPEHAATLRDRAKTLEGRADTAERTGRLPYATVMQHGRERTLRRASTLAPVTRPSRLLKKRGDFEAARAVDVQRQAAAYEAQEALGMLPTRPHRGGKIGQKVGGAIDRRLLGQPINALQARLPKRIFRPEHDLVALALEGTIRPGSMAADLAKERARVEAEYRGLKSPRMREANRLRARTIDRAMNDAKAMGNEAGVFKSAHEFAQRINELQAQGVDLHQLAAGAAARAKLFPYAISHMNARYSDELRQRAAEAVKQAHADVRGKATEARGLRLAEERHRGAADVQTAQRNRRVLSSDAEVVAATRARTQASRELTAANRELRAAERSQDADRAHAARGRVSAAKAQARTARQAHAQAIASFEGRVERAVAKRQRGQKLTRQEARLAKFDRHPTGRLARLEDVRANRVRAEKELHAAKGRLAQARRRHAQTPAAELVDAHGRKLSNEQIHAHMRSDRTGPVVDPARIAYVPHELDLSSATAYYQQALRRRPSTGEHKRTGAAYKAGATSPLSHVVIESMMRQAGALSNIRSFDKFIGDAGIRRADGSYFTMAEAEHEVQRRSVDSHNIDVPGEPELIPVRVFKAKLSAEAKKAIRDEQAPVPGAGVEGVLEPWQRRLDRGDRTSRNVVLLPRPVVERIDQHLQRSTPVGRVGQGVTSMLRMTVLPFSTKWIVGNVAEAVLRLAAVGATVLPGDRNIAAGRYVLRELVGGDIAGLEAAVGKRAAREIVDHLLGGQLYGSRALRVRRTGAEMFGDVGQAVAHTPVLRELGGSYRAITGGIFKLNKMFEQRAQLAALGKFIRRDIHEFTGSWAKSVRLQHEAIQEAARGLTDTAKQHEAARYIDETLGQYSRFSPHVRHLIQNAAPFLPWYLASVRWVFWTLPAHHPIKSGLLAQAELAFSQDWADQHKDIPPQIKGALRQASRTPGGGWLDLARFTPWGGPGPVLAGDNAALISPLYPQFSGAVNALQGKDPFGRALQAPKTAANPSGRATPGQERIAALNSLAEALIPGVSLGRRFREHGETAYPTSTILSPKTKGPGTRHKMSAARRIFDPFRPTYLRQSTAATGSPGAGLDRLDREDVRQAIRDARQEVDHVDAQEIRELIREANR